MKKITLLIPVLAALILELPAAQAIGLGGPILNINARGPRLFSAPVLSGTQDYQIGSEWGKKPVRTKDLQNANPIFKRVALATARYGGATAFYLGYFNGHHVMATNYHVADAENCDAVAQFPLLGKQFPCKKLFGKWTDVDFALFSIDVKPQDEAALKALGQNMAFNASLYPGEELLTMGFGIAGNPLQRDLMANQDSDCKIFSQRDEFRFMADPDEFNPGPYKAWSFSNGCDVSHGDSGSAFIDRNTGDVVGLIWTGKIPKHAKIQDSRYLDQLMKTPNEDVWTELSYAVPAPKIREVLFQVISDSSLDEDSRNTIAEIVK